MKAEDVSSGISVRVLPSEAELGRAHALVNVGLLLVRPALLLVFNHLANGASLGLDRVPKLLRDLHVEALTDSARAPQPSEKARLTACSFLTHASRPATYLARLSVAGAFWTMPLPRFDLVAFLSACLASSSCSASS